MRNIGAGVLGMSIGLSLWNDKDPLVEGGLVVLGLLSFGLYRMETRYGERTFGRFGDWFAVWIPFGRNVAWSLAFGILMRIGLLSIDRGPIRLVYLVVMVTMVSYRLLLKRGTVLMVALVLLYGGLMGVEGYFHDSFVVVSPLLGMTVMGLLFLYHIMDPRTERLSWTIFITAVGVGWLLHGEVSGFSWDGPASVSACLMLMLDRYPTTSRRWRFGQNAGGLGFTLVPIAILSQAALLLTEGSILFGLMWWWTLRRQRPYLYRPFASYTPYAWGVTLVLLGLIVIRISNRLTLGLVCFALIPPLIDSYVQGRFPFVDGKHVDRSFWSDD